MKPTSEQKAVAEALGTHEPDYQMTPKEAVQYLGVLRTSAALYAIDPEECDHELWAERQKVRALSLAMDALAATEPQEQHEAPAELVEAVRKLLRGFRGNTVAGAGIAIGPHLAVVKAFNVVLTAPWEEAVRLINEAPADALQAAIEIVLRQQGGSDEQADGQRCSP